MQHSSRFDIPSTIRYGLLLSVLVLISGVFWAGHLTTDAMERLLRGHIHWMGSGILSVVMLLIITLTSLKPYWKKLLGWTFGIGAVAYPASWILMESCCLKRHCIVFSRFSEREEGHGETHG